MERRAIPRVQLGARMPKAGKRLACLDFNFPSWDGEVFLPDDEGLEFEDIDQARAQASRALAEMARDILPGSSGRRVLRMAVRDAIDAPGLELRLMFEVVARE